MPSVVADLKFTCPECRQKIRVQSTASGSQIDCPTCYSTITIPQDSQAIVHVETRRKLAILPGTYDTIYEALETHQKRLVIARDGVANAQAEVRRMQGDITRLRHELTVSQKDREVMAARLLSLESNRDAASAAQVELADLRRLNGQMKSERDELKARAVRAESNHTGMRDRLVADERERSEMKAHIALLQAQLEEFPQLRKQAARLEPLMQKIAELESQLAALSVERDALAANESAARAEVTALKLEAGKLQSATPPLSTTISPAEAPASPTALQAEPDPVQTMKIQAMEAQLSEARLWAGELSREVADLHQAIKSLHTDREDNHKEREDANSVQEELRRKLTDREAALAKATLQAQAADHETEKLRARAEAISAEKERLQVHLEKSLIERKQTESRLEKQLIDSTLQLETFATERQALQALAEKNIAAAAPDPAVLVQNEQLKAALADATSSQEIIRKESEATLKRVAELEFTIRNQRTEMAALRVEPVADAELKATVSQLEADLAAARSLAENAEDVYKTLIEDSDRDLSSYEQRVKDLLAERDHLAAELRSANPESEPNALTARKTKSSLEDLTESVQQLESRLASSGKYIEEIESERDELHAEIEVLKATLDRTKQHVAALQTRRDQMRDEISELHENLGAPARR